MRTNRFFKCSTFVAVGVLLVLAAFGATAAAQGADTTAPVVTNVIPADGSTIYANGGSTVYYQSGNSTPTVIKADYSDEASGSGVDPTSVMVHLDVANMLFDCPVQTASHVECNATATDLFPGTHPIDVYVADIDGNLTMNRTWVTVTVDNAAPSYSNLTPVGGSIIYTSQLNSTSTNDMGALRIDYDLTDPAPSSGWSPMSHINESVPPGVMGAMISNTSCVKTPTATDPTHYSCQMNRAKLLHLGDNTLSVLLKDKVGNASSDYTDPSGLNHYTVVDDVAPVVSGLNADAATISASYSDPLPTGALSTNLASGINAGSAAVTVYGTPVDGCTATDTGISCPTPAGLPGGTHSIEVVVSDNSGNQGTGIGSLTLADTAAPVVTFTGPAGWSGIVPTITGIVTDAEPSSGIASASAAISTAGYSQTFPCTVDSSGNISCPASGLPEGHLSVAISVLDNAGNNGTGSGAIHVSVCTGEKPSLSLGSPQAYWDSYADYLARTLSVDYTVTNTGTLYAHHAKMTSSAPNAGVTLLTAMPKSIGSMAGGTTKNVVLQYNVPTGVKGFRIVNTAWAEDGCGTYTYP